MRSLFGGRRIEKEGAGPAQAHADGASGLLVRYFHVHMHKAISPMVILVLLAGGVGASLLANRSRQAIAPAADASTAADADAPEAAATDWSASAAMSVASAESAYVMPRPAM